MPTLHPSAATPLLLLMGVVASLAVHHLFLWFGRRRETLHPWVVSHSICPDCRDGVVKDQLESWRGRR